MWLPGWRERAWDELQRPWDLIVVGGGITGAGILREAARSRLRALLVEARDFAYGTSSRSSKLVHGGLRYLRNAQIRMTYEAVRERERLLREGRGLVTPLGFLMANFRGDRPPWWVFGLGLTLYDLLALRWGHRHYTSEGLRELCPQLTSDALLGGYRYLDAQVDDARLVLRVLSEARLAGAEALNYARAIGLLRDRRGQACGVVVRDESVPAGRTAEVQAPVLINATGVWADALRQPSGAGRAGKSGRKLRRLRGSHLVFSWQRLPLVRAVGFLHPRDHRPVFVVPWEGITLIGTTDVDHAPDLALEPAISHSEADYLLTAVNYCFPGQDLAFSDVLSTFAGVRPVVDTGQPNPSAESREHVLWDEHGLLTVAGGKLTTFRLMARGAMRAVRARCPPGHGHPPSPELLHRSGHLQFGAGSGASPALRRVAGRYGQEADELLGGAGAGDLAPIVPGLPMLWAELRWASSGEAVVHLDDLLLRRVRLGFVAPNGGLGHLDRIRSLVQAGLGWSDETWEQEALRYQQIWTQSYSPALCA